MGEEGCGDEGGLFCENYRYDHLFVSVLPLVCFNGNIVSEGYYRGSFEAGEGQLTVDVWWNIARALRKIKRWWCLFPLPFSSSLHLSRLFFFNSPLTLSSSSSSPLFLLSPSQMNVETDDKRTRTRSKGIRGECHFSPSCQTHTHTHTVRLTKGSLCLFGEWSYTGDAPFLRPVHCLKPGCRSTVKLSVTFWFSHLCATDAALSFVRSTLLLTHSHCVTDVFQCCVIV